MDRRYDWVFLDAGETLFQLLSLEAGFAAALTEVGYQVPGAELAAVVERARLTMMTADHVGPAPEYAVSVERARARRERLVTDVLRGVGVREADFEVCQAAVEAGFVGTRCFSLFPDVVPALRGLRSSGYRLGIVSNWEHRLALLCRSHGVAEQFEFILASEAEGFSKPGPQLFRRALELAQVEPGRAVHVGDSFEHDVLGATALGIGAVLLDRGGYYPAGQWGLMIRSLVDLPGLLNSAQA